MARRTRRLLFEYNRQASDAANGTAPPPGNVTGFLRTGLTVSCSQFHFPLTSMTVGILPTCGIKEQFATGSDANVEISAWHRVGGD